MKTIAKITLLLFLLTSQSAFTQEKDTLFNSDTVYWFYFKLDVERDSATHEYTYQFTKIYDEIFSGTKRDFLEFQKQKLKTRHIAIGPFAGKDDAGKAKKYYINCQKGNFNMQEQDSSYLYFYFLEVKSVKKNNTFELARIPKAVSEGGHNAFSEMLALLLPLKKLVIGPFPKRQDVEISKSLNLILSKKKIKKSKYEDYDIFFWFPAVYNINIVSGKVFHKQDTLVGKIAWGNLKDYYNFKDSCLKNRLVPIGPFSEYEVAKLAYLLRRPEHFNLGQDNKDETLYTYGIILKKRGKRYMPDKIPAAVYVAKYKEFIDFISSEKQHVYMGPFDNQTDAEISKMILRTKKRRQFKKWYNHAYWY